MLISGKKLVKGLEHDYNPSLLVAPFWITRFQMFLPVKVHETIVHIKSNNFTNTIKITL